METDETTTAQIEQLAAEGSSDNTIEFNEAEMEAPRAAVEAAEVIVWLDEINKKIDLLLGIVERLDPLMFRAAKCEDQHACDLFAEKYAEVFAEYAAKSAESFAKYMADKVVPFESEGNASEGNQDTNETTQNICDRASSESFDEKQSESNDNADSTSAV